MRLKTVSKYEYCIIECCRVLVNQSGYFVIQFNFHNMSGSVYAGKLKNWAILKTIMVSISPKLKQPTILVSR